MSRGDVEVARLAESGIRHEVVDSGQGIADGNVAMKIVASRSGGACVSSCGLPAVVVSLRGLLLSINQLSGTIPSTISALTLLTYVVQAVLKPCGGGVVRMAAAVVTVEWEGQMGC